jgi:outer membrane protein assembly factor BamE (lipoprotein component of BamABCDE complex)
LPPDRVARHEDCPLRTKCPALARSRHVPSVPLRRLALAGGLLATLAGCNGDFFSFPPQVRGNKVDAEVIGQLVPGTSTRQDVSAVLGSPTVSAAFDDNTWIYISEVTKPVIAGTQGVEAQQVYLVTFDQKGTLIGVTKRTQDDALPVSVVDRTTPSPGTEASWWQQLIGNVGKFSAGAGTTTQGAQGTSTNPGNF